MTTKTKEKPTTKSASERATVASLQEVPDFGSEAEEQAWWDEHDLDAAAFERPAERPSHLPPPRPKVRSSTTSIRLEADVIKRLKALARKKGTGYQTLLKQFVGERLYEEEKREGLLEQVESTE